MQGAPSTADRRKPGPHIFSIWVIIFCMFGGGFFPHGYYGLSLLQPLSWSVRSLSMGYVGSEIPQGPLKALQFFELFTELKHGHHFQSRWQAVSTTTAQPCAMMKFSLKQMGKEATSESCNSPAKIL